VTVIVGVKTTNSILIGHDTLIVEGELGREAALSKVVEKEIITKYWKFPIGIGVAGSPFLLNDITYNFELPEWPSNYAPASSHAMTDEYVLGRLIVAMKERYDDENRSLAALIAVNGLIYACDARFSGVRCVDMYDGVGDGSYVAMAALEALLINRGYDGCFYLADLVTAMDVAGKFCRSCGDYLITEIKGATRI